ncbi:MAG: zinc ABC transporter substrate-binding protein, partial [Thermoplasmata archaeon]|nr:zinc ABC transporter substrate-binding protein [Thermoplasmata archaeon]
MKNLVLLMGLIVVAAVLNAGCLDSDDDDDRIGVIVTILPQKEFVERVGGDRVKVTVMVPPGQSPHTYEPTPGQMKEVARAGLYFKVGSGVEFETVWMDTLKEQNSNMEIVDGHKGITLIPM